MSLYLAEQFGVIPKATRVLLLALVGSQNVMKKQYNFIIRHLSLKFSCNQIIEAKGLILRHNMFGVPIKFFSSFANW